MPAFAERELDVMKVLWERGPSTAAEVRDALAHDAGLDLAYNSVLTVLRILEEKGYERWLVLEQDLAITGTEPPAGGGPALDVARSIEFLSTSAPRRERVSLT